MYKEVNTNCDAFTSFKKENDILDMFYFSTLNIGKCKELSMILKAILTLSHRKASVECGFSINKNLVDINMSQESIITKRLVKDHMIANNLTPSTTEISRNVIICQAITNEVCRAFRGKTSGEAHK